MDSDVRGSFKMKMFLQLAACRFLYKQKICKYAYSWNKSMAKEFVLQKCKGENALIYLELIWKYMP